jgi:hypothetical protein
MQFISITRVPLIRLVFGVAWFENFISCLCFTLGSCGGFLLATDFINNTNATLYLNRGIHLILDFMMY